MFRILSLNETQPDEPTASQPNSASKNYNDSTSPDDNTNQVGAVPPKVAGVVPSPMEKKPMRLDFEDVASSQNNANDGTVSISSQKSKITSLIEQSAKAYLKNRLVDQIEDGKCTFQ